MCRHQCVKETYFQIMRANIKTIETIQIVLSCKSCRCKFQNSEIRVNNECEPARLSLCETCTVYNAPCTYILWAMFSIRLNNLMQFDIAECCCFFLCAQEISFELCFSFIHPIAKVFQNMVFGFEIKSIELNAFKIEANGFHVPGGMVFSLTLFKMHRLRKSFT